MDDEIVLRDFAPEDQEDVRQLILAGLRDHWGSIDESLNADLDDIAVSYASGRTIVVERSNELVGTGTLLPITSTIAEIRRMSVDSSLRHRGVGRVIVDELIETARRWMAHKVVVETSSAWTDVVDFYVAVGFKITGTRPGEFGEDTWFELLLNSHPRHARPGDPGHDPRGWEGHRAGSDGPADGEDRPR